MLKHVLGVGSAYAYGSAALVLVAIYVNAFPFWRRLVGVLGRDGAAWVPFVLVAGLALAAGAAVLRQPRARPLLPPLAGAAVVAVAALLLVDPAFPAKRIHVVEYIVMALVVRRALSPRLAGTSLLWMTTLITAVLGCHDELLQGIYPDRTFGLRDIGVNALVGLAGALGAHACVPGSMPPVSAGVRLTLGEWLGLGALTSGCLLLLVAVPAFRGSQPPLWSLLPLAAGGLAWALLCEPRVQGAAPGMRAAAVLMLATGFYPLATHAFTLAIH